MEWIVSGYCRTQDQARTVLLELEQGQWDCDCDFPGCAFADVCPVGKQLQSIQNPDKVGGIAP